MADDINARFTQLDNEIKDLKAKNAHLDGILMEHRKMLSELNKTVETIWRRLQPPKP